MVIKFDGLPSKCISLLLTGYNLMDWSFTVHFCVIIIGDSECIRSRILCMKLALRFYVRMDSFYRENYNAREEANEQNHYGIAILKKLGVLRFI